MTEAAAAHYSNVDLSCEEKVEYMKPIDHSSRILLQFFILEYK